MGREDPTPGKLERTAKNVPRDRQERPGTNPDAANEPHGGRPDTNPKSPWDLFRARLGYEMLSAVARAGSEPGN